MKSENAMEEERDLFIILQRASLVRTEANRTHIKLTRITKARMMTDSGGCAVGLIYNLFSSINLK